VKERRDFSRVGFRAGAMLRWREKAIRIEVEDLSLHGMRARCHESIPTGEEVETTIYLTGVEPEIPVTVKGEVVRVDKEILGIKFLRMDTDSFIHLRNIIAHNLGDEEQVMDEFIRFNLQ
jgi:hypothetical protein